MSLHKCKGILFHVDKSMLPLAPPVTKAVFPCKFISFTELFCIVFNNNRL